jgi:cyclic pyranopterin phosphate synthase
MNRDGLLVDSHGRVMRDLRISVTDRCNFRCLYCLPETEAAFNFYRGRWAKLPNPAPIRHQWAPRSQLLSFEEIERLVRVAVGLGIDKLRLTGGEPLLRQQLEKLVTMLAAIDGVRDLAMTTNGFHFQQKAVALRDAGLRRISFSLDSLDRANFQKMTGRDGLGEVLAGIRLAQELELHPVKVNAVIIRGVNDHEIESLAEFGRSHGLVMRFIEFMPLDSARVWLKELVVPAREILERLQGRFDLRPLAASHASETARRWTFADGRTSTPPVATPSPREARAGRGLGRGVIQTNDGLPLPGPLLPRREERESASGEIGLIAPVSEPFCGHCNRLRLTADGQLRTCLFSVAEHDLRSRLRHGATDEELASALKEAVGQKEARHHIGEPDFVPPSRSMSCIGG